MWKDFEYESPLFHSVICMIVKWRIWLDWKYLSSQIFAEFGWIGSTCPLRSLLTLISWVGIEESTDFLILNFCTSLVFPLLLFFFILLMFLKSFLCPISNQCSCFQNPPGLLFPQIPGFFSFWAFLGFWEQIAHWWSSLALYWGFC